jgi:hypothetical protein
MQQQGQQGGGGGGGGGTPSGGGGGGESGADGGGDAQNAPKNPDSNYENAENSKPNVDMSGQGDESAPATDLTRSIDKAVKGLSKAQKARSPILKLKKASK